MNQFERQQIGEMWLVLASMYGKELSKMTLKLMLDSVSDLPAEGVLKALNDWPRVSKRREYPLPFDIREMVTPEPSVEAKGREILARIHKAVKDFGYDRGSEAFAFMGEEAVQIVRERGGWYSVCMEQDIFEPAVASQIRERAKDLVQYKNELRDFDKLEAPKEKPQLEARAFLLDFASKIKNVTPKGEGA